MHQKKDTIGPSTVRNYTFYEESFSTDEQKKRKIETVYPGGRFKHEDEYKIIKVRKITMTHTFKHVKFRKEEGTKSRILLRKKNAQILQHG